MNRKSENKVFDWSKSEEDKLVMGKWKLEAG
jgi:hypothetical protein